MRSTLLALAGCRAGEQEALSAQQWHELDALADGHRLRPHLHARLIRGEIAIPVPNDISLLWQVSYRENALYMLAQRHALKHAAEVLEKAGIRALGLKGTALAWRVWPAPAERPMRDIDILVAEAQAPLAYRVLREANWDAPQLDDTALARLAAQETHLPGLQSADGLMLEVHAHAWASAPLSGLTMPDGDDDGIMQRAGFDESLGIAVPSSEDMLAHLVIHCAVSHLFNTGPLALADIDYLLRADAIDWAKFWRRAERQGFTRAAAIMLHLVNRWRQPGAAEMAGIPISIAPELIARAEDLLCQDPLSRKDINAIAGLRHGGAADRLGDHPLQPRSIGQRLRDVPARGLSIGKSLLNAQTRADGAATAAMARWLASD